MFHLGKTSLSSGFFVSERLLLFACAATNLVFKTTGVEGTHQTLAAISFQVEVNHSCYHRHIRTNVPSFRFCRIYNSLFKARSFRLIYIFSRDVDLKSSKHLHKLICKKINYVLCFTWCRMRIRSSQ